MISPEALGKGMAILVGSFGMEIDEARIETYRLVLSPFLTDEEWIEGVAHAAAFEKFFPSPSVIREYAQHGLDGQLRLEAADAYDVILDSYERGENIDRREIEGRYGKASADAFMAAGGSRDFAWCEPKDQPFRRKRFLEGYTSAVREDDAQRLLPAGSQKALPERGESSFVSALDALKRIEEEECEPF